MYADGETVCEVAVTMPSLRERLRDAIDRLTDEQVCRILYLIESGEEAQQSVQTLERLSTDPGFSVPLLGLRTFHVVQPVASKGLPASKMLVEDRR
jgi:hypothetical protein